MPVTACRTMKAPPSPRRGVMALPPLRVFPGQVLHVQALLAKALGKTAHKNFATRLRRK